MDKPLDAIYCEGWDPCARAVTGPLTSEVARARDISGEQYAVVIFSGSLPLVLIEVAWRHHMCVVWGFDEDRRRMVKRDMRRLAGGQLVLVEEIVWEYSHAEQDEFDPAVPCRTVQTRTDRPDGGVMVITERTRTSRDAARDSLMLDVPSFGDWSTLILMGNSTVGTETVSDFIDDGVLALLAELPGHGGDWRPEPLLPRHLSNARLVERYPPPSDVAVVPFVRPVWQPPRPLLPDPRVLAHDRAPRPMSLHGEQLLLESHIAGSLRLPTGRVIASDPDDYFLADRAPYTVTVPPGTYRVFLNVVRSPEGIGMSPRVAACGLLIRDEQVSSWELALLPGEDPRLLRDGDAYGFGVDSGMASFMDAAAVQEVVGGDHRLGEGQVAGVRLAFLDGSDSGADLVAFESGWGDGTYPVWIGRTPSRAVACFVADMLLSPT
ncbi:DUF4241 domain-containing protein [Streptomyces sp. NPDC051018]|uniref:DUF4241 domain-containing protein n=1 Tax=Streptomyces sp. NPDC051018 TaxID=3365639 RepID=UPI0037ACA3AB